MNSTYIQEVLLKINSADSEQTVKRLEQTIKNCAAEKDKLIKAKPDQKDWTEQEWKNWQKCSAQTKSRPRHIMPAWIQPQGPKHRTISSWNVLM